MAIGIKCQFECVLGKDPEMRFTPTEKAVATVNGAVRMGNKGDESDTFWAKLIFWERAAEVVNTQLHAKDRIVVTDASFSVREYDDKDGNRRTMIEFTVREFYKVEKLDWSNGDAPKAATNQRQASNNKGSAKPATASRKAAASYDDDDDIPF